MTVQKTIHHFEADSPGVNFMPPSVFYICLISGGVLEYLFPTAFSLIAHPLCKGIGIVLGVSGFSFMFLAHKRFETIGTNVPTNEAATTLVTHGAYRFSRNPMYVGGSAFFLGLGLAVGSMWMLMSYLPLGMYLSYYVIPKEEAYMKRTFKDAYLEYCRRVRRWL